MKFHLLFILLSAATACFTSCGSRHTGSHNITFTNTSSVALIDKPVIISRKALSKQEKGPYPLFINEAGDTIPSQVDDLDGDHKWDEVFLLVNMPAGQTGNIRLAWVDSMPRLQKRSNIRFGVRQTVRSRVEPALSDTFYADQLPHVIGYQHYQTDGPTWENDKVAFRQYMDGRNSIDVFGKKVSYLTPDDVGIGKDGFTENNYSVMKDWGTDILAVANSAGIGGFSLMFKDSLPRLGVTEQDSLNNVDSTICEVLSKGPLRSRMKVRYMHWRPLGRDYSVEQTTSIWPGMYAYNNSVSFSNLKGDETMVVGLVNSNSNQPLQEMRIGPWVVLYTFDKQSVNKQWLLGLALVLPAANYLGYIEAPKKGSLSTTWLGKLKMENKKPVEYFAVAGWELSAKEFKDSTHFKTYLSDFVNQLTSEVKVNVMGSAGK